MEEERKTQELEETESCPIDKRRETIQFPWGIAIFMGVLMALIIGCFVIVMVLEHK